MVSVVGESIDEETTIDPSQGIFPHEKSALETMLPIIKTGVIFALGGYLSAYVTRKVREKWDQLRRKFVTRVIVKSTNIIYTTLIEWLSLQPELQNTNNIRLVTNLVNENDFFLNEQNPYSIINKSELADNLYDSNDLGKLERVIFALGDGSHSFHWGGKKIKLHYSRSSETAQRRENSRRVQQIQHEKIRFEVWGEHKGFFKKMFQEVANLQEKMEQQSSTIYLMDQYADTWEKENTNTKPIKMDFVILKDGQSEKLLKDCREFLERKETYESLGIPFRRGYLFYGYPGCGKTTTVRALAGELGLPICIMSLSNKELNDDGLSVLLNRAPRPCIILFEDIDSCFVQRKPTKEGENKRVTFSGLLNALDGIGSQEGRMFFMTTNHVERLSPALVRAGRVDLKVEFNKANKDQVERLFLKFFQGHPKLAKQFAEKIPEDKMSMALIQQHFMNYFERPKQCLDNYNELLLELEKAEKIDKNAGIDTKSLKDKTNTTTDSSTTVSNDAVKNNNSNIQKNENSDKNTQEKVEKTKENFNKIEIEIENDKEIENTKEIENAKEIENTITKNTQNKQI
ncbi:chaperone bcs1 [Anaeramoeba flamelloides]|uniref:Chaperone bcs1 n=1 Tax=Anaeramoeba flamelloides TaxID=1746091 RepID=A0ABQ8YEJ3_9EUKA|nr:chaperone bcs1 [Anaeramoeba flamelloides]